MEQQIKKIAHRSIIDGVWQKDSWEVTIGGKTHDFRDLAKAHGIELKGADKHKKTKKQINTDVKVEEHADLEQPFDSGHSEEHGDGDSEGSE